MNKWHYKPKAWCSSRFEWHWVPDQISGINYAGITLFGHSLIYSDYWHKDKL